MFSTTYGRSYQYLMGPTSGGEFSQTPFTIISTTQISEANLESIATVLAGGTPPSGWMIQADNPPVTTKTY